jgi:hypothetical protein
MSWLGIIIAIIAAWLAIKVLGFVLKLALWVVVLLGLYWFAAPYLGLPVPF